MSTLFMENGSFSKKSMDEAAEYYGISENIRHNTIGLDYKSDVLYVSDTGVVANVPYEPKIE